MAISDAKTDLRRYLQGARDTMLWKLDGLPEYDIRRPLTPTGTNLLGLVKHLSGVELGYFGDTFGRPVADPPPWTSATLLQADPNADMWATAAESRGYITGWYRRAWAHADTTIETLALDATGQVPWWPAGPDGEVSLHRVMIHVIAETHRHAGHADILRELIDGAAGMLDGNSNLPEADAASWAAHRQQLDRAAREASRG